MAFVVEILKGFSNPQRERAPIRFETYEAALDFCEQEGIPVDVELADRGPDVVWARINDVGD